MPEIVECSANSGVAPARVVSSHQEDQLLDVGFGPRATWPSVIAPVVLLRDQVSVPTKQGIWCHPGPDLEEPFTADRFCLDGESEALPIGEPRSLAAQLLAQRSVTLKLRFLLLEIFDYVPLMPIDPASEDQHQKLPRQSVHRAEFRPATAEKMGRNRRSSDRPSP